MADEPRTQPTPDERYEQARAKARENANRSAFNMAMATAPFVRPKCPESGERMKPELDASARSTVWLCIAGIAGGILISATCVGAILGVPAILFCLGLTTNLPEFDFVSKSGRRMSRRDYANSFVKPVPGNGTDPPVA